MQDAFEATALSTYRYVLMATDAEVPGKRVHLKSEEINLGDVVEIILNRFFDFSSCKDTARGNRKRNQ